MEMVRQNERLRQEGHGRRRLDSANSHRFRQSSCAKCVISRERTLPMLFRFLAFGALAVTQGYVLGAPAVVTASRAAVSMHFPPINESVDKGNPKVVTTVKCEGVRNSDVCNAELLK
jgi:hypothetical protein